jgi:hypothetical protein
MEECGNKGVNLNVFVEEPTLETPTSIEKNIFIKRECLQRK